MNPGLRSKPSSPKRAQPSSDSTKETHPVTLSSWPTSSLTSTQDPGGAWTASLRQRTISGRSMYGSLITVYIVERCWQLVYWDLGCLPGEFCETD